jgi:OmcA/MtrC family decaheme c-type cytochrome
VTCHMPLATDAEEVRPGNPEQTIHFKYMIHSIHRGEDLENGFVVAGHNQSIHDYGEVVYPGDLRNCSACHVNNSYQLSGLPDDLLPTLTPQAWWSPTQPQAAACLSCHDDDSTAVHAYTNSSFFGESCVTCHGEGKEYSVDKVHAR